METVGIVTFHHSRSYGACLQAWATLHVIQSLGYEAELVNYENPYEQKIYKASHKNLLSYIHYIAWKLKSVVLLEKHWNHLAFGNIDDLYNNKVSKRVLAKEDLRDVSYDILLSGSDQIWNPDITGGLDDIFLLNFGHANKRVSYASSMGSHLICDYEKNMYYSSLIKFSSISVRENFAVKELQKVLPTNTKIQIVLDPTLLLTADTWDSLTKKVDLKEVPPKYILCFVVAGNTNLYRDSLVKIKQLTGLPIFSIQVNKYKRKPVDKVLAGVNCNRLIKLIQEADYIITDSFHGTAFSIIFQKKFIALSNPNNPIRVKELLRKLNLLERLDNPEVCCTSIDYNSVNHILDKEKEKSLDWLKKALKNEYNRNYQ